MIKIEVCMHSREEMTTMTTMMVMKMGYLTMATSRAHGIYITLTCDEKSFSIIKRTFEKPPIVVVVVVVVVNGREQTVLSVVGCSPFNPSLTFMGFYSTTAALFPNH
jgi:hypothetical protein